MSLKRGIAVVAGIVVVGVAATMVAQPPEGDVRPERPGSGERRGPPEGAAGGERRGPREGGPGGERGGPPSPERMIEHAMGFDADGDGKLDRAELTKFFEQMQAARMRGGPGEGRGRGGPGEGLRDGGPRGNGGPSDGFRRPPEGGGPGREGRGPGDTPRRDRNEL